VKLYRVVFTKTAQYQLKTEAAKWREGHPKNTYLLEDEVADAVRVLAVTPRVGGESRDVRLRGVRRIVLLKSAFLLFYRVLEDQRVVELLRLWYARRGTRPRLRRVDSKSPPR
jgi:hypothetical protein